MRGVMSIDLRFPLPRFPESAERIRAEVREFLTGYEKTWSAFDRAHSWTNFDAAFSEAVGARGWIGMTWPKTYGGGERSELDRYVVLEEMLAVGAPVGAHWFADRQSGPLLLNIGTAEQRERFLPPITRGELSFCIGLSEPDAGSDLASLRTSAKRVDGGWVVNGTKVWTTNAHLCDYMIALVRTTPKDDVASRHAGLSQVLIDLGADGINISPIRDLTGESHFNEVHFEDVFVPQDMLVGTEGEGWQQATAELAFERSGPDRYLSSFPLIQAVLPNLSGDGSPDVDVALGLLISHYAALRGMSVSVARLLEQGHSPSQQAALIKDRGVDVEQDTPYVIADLLDMAGRCPDADLKRAIDYLTQTAPSFSLRGGTREIMRGMTARGLGLR